MAAGSTRVTIGITSNTSGLQRGLNQAKGSLTGFQKATGGVASGLKGLVGGMAAVYGVSKLGGFLADSVTQGREAQKVMARTSNVIKTTGGVANVTAKQVGDLAASISNKTAVDDEAIQTGANFLLTFKNVRNEVGKGNKIFDQATAAAVDLSAAGFGSVDGASKMLGKSLNDPIKGISALGRAGVTFTDQQKKQIKVMTESGNILGAQKIILGEVQSQVGGAAASQATAGERLKVTVDNIKESIGTALIPVLDTMATYLADKLPGWITTAGNAFNTVKGYVEPVIATLRSFFGGLDSGTTGASGKFAQLQTTVSTVLGAVRPIISSTVTIVTALWAKFGGIITTYVTNALTNVMNFVRGAFKVIEGLFNVIAGVLTGDWKRVWTGLKQVVSGALTAIKAVISQAWNVITTVFKTAGTIIKSVVSAAFNGLKGAASAGVSALVGFVKGIPGKVKSGLGNLATLLLSAGGDIVAGLAQGIRDKASDAINAAKNLAGGVKDAVAGALSIFSPSRVMREFGRYVSQGLALGMIDRAGDVTSSVLSLAKIINEELPRNIKKPKAIRAWYKEHNKQVAEGTKAVLKSLRDSAAAQTAALKAQRNDYANAVKDSALSFASLSNLQLGENENLTAGGITQFLNDRLAAIQNFNAKLAHLRAMGASDDVYNSIVQQGVQAGTTMADAIIAGGPSALAGINSLQSQIGSASNVLGANTANSLYGAGVSAAEGFARGLDTLIAKVNKSAKNISKSLIKSLKRALGIHSPSKRMAELGGYTMDGLLKPLDAKVVAVRGAELAQAFATGYADSGSLSLKGQKNLYTSTPSYGAPGDVTMNVYVDSNMSPVQYGLQIEKARDAARAAGVIR
jgi:phage-related protein